MAAVSCPACHAGVAGLISTATTASRDKAEKSRKNREGRGINYGYKTVTRPWSMAQGAWPSVPWWPCHGDVEYGTGSVAISTVVVVCGARWVLE